MYKLLIVTGSIILFAYYMDVEMNKKTETRANPYLVPDNTGAFHALKKDPTDKNEILGFKYVAKKQITHDSFILSFQLPEGYTAGINTGQHVAIEALIPTEEFPEGEEVSRKYTPVSPIDQTGTFDLLIKVYYKDSHPDFLEGGKLTQWLDKLELNSTVNMRGPIGRFFYSGNGNFKLGTKEKPFTWREHHYKRVGMLCGGTGITPIYQVLLSAHLNRDSTPYSLVFGNRSTKDILLNDELDHFVKCGHFKFDVHYTIDKMEEGWTGETGYISKEMIAKYMPPPADDTLILLCGSGKMCKKYLAPILHELGYAPTSIFIF